MSDGRRLVLRRPPFKLPKNEKTRKKFFGEAERCLGLVHPNIVEVHEVAARGTQWYVVQEHVEGVDLSRVVHKAKKLKLRMPKLAALFTVGRVADAIDYAFSTRDPDGKPLRLLHHCLSPTSVLVTEEGGVKVQGFGLDDQAVVQRSDHAAPEQIAGGTVDERTVVFRSGLILYELLCGVPLFDEGLSAAEMEKTLGHLSRSFQQHCPDADPELEKVVLRALAFAREQRFANARELGAALEAFLSGDAKTRMPLELGRFVRAVQAQHDLSSDFPRVRDATSKPLPIKAQPTAAGPTAAAGPLAAGPMAAERTEVEGEPSISMPIAREAARRGPSSTIDRIVERTARVVRPVRVPPAVEDFARQAGEWIAQTLERFGAWFAGAPRSQQLATILIPIAVVIGTVIGVAAKGDRRPAGTAVEVAEEDPAAYEPPAPDPTQYPPPDGEPAKITILPGISDVPAPEGSSYVALEGAELRATNEEDGEVLLWMESGKLVERIRPMEGGKILVMVPPKGPAGFIAADALTRAKPIEVLGKEIGFKGCRVDVKRTLDDCLSKGKEQTDACLVGCVKHSPSGGPGSRCAQACQAAFDRCARTCNDTKISFDEDAEKRAASKRKVRRRK